MSSPQEITANQLSRLVGTPDAPLLIDVRIDEDYESDPRLLPLSFRHSFQNVTALASELSGRKAVVICHKGLKLSQGSAAILRSLGIACEYLEGGHLSWAQAGLPLVHANNFPKKAPNFDGSLWVTRHRPKIDRIACPWLIKRFVDAKATFLFVSPDEVENVAARFDAIPFDVEGVFWSHRGEACTFDTMIEEFGLKTEPLVRLAQIVRAADTNRHDCVPQAAGLAAMSFGLSRMYRDDLKQLDAAMTIYDSFYRWARDAHNETHDWATAPKAK